MPELAGVAEADGLAVFDDVGNDENFRMPGQQEPSFFEPYLPQSITSL